MGLVIKTQCYHHCGQDSFPGLETEIPHQATVCHGKKKKKKKKKKKERKKKEKKQIQ